MMVTQVSPNYRMGRGGGGLVARQPVTKTQLTKKYWASREAELRKTHQQSLDDFIQRGGFDANTVGKGVRQYFAGHQGFVDQQTARFEAQCKEIDDDPLMDSMRKQEAKQRLQQPARAAWPQALEDGWIRTYGLDPRDLFNEWNAMIMWSQQETTTVFQHGQLRERERSNWERQVPLILSHPEWDGSVAPVLMLERPRRGGKTTTEKVAAAATSVDVVEEPRLTLSDADIPDEAGDAPVDEDATPEAD